MPFLTVHFLIQLLLPLRHWLYPGNVLWNEEGFRFSWHLKIMEKRGRARFYATDPRTGAHWELRCEGLLSDKQAGRMMTQPDLILAFAHILAERTGIPGVEVRADVRVSLNGRPPRPLIDPRVNLAAESDGFLSKRWILPLELPAPGLLTRLEEDGEPLQELTAHRHLGHVAIHEAAAGVQARLAAVNAEPGAEPIHLVRQPGLRTE